MSDIKIIIQQRDRVLLLGETVKGVDWISYQVGYTAIEFSVSKDIFDEAFLDALRAEGLTFEIK